MKTKIIMMSALLALLATGCDKEDNNVTNDGRLKIFAEGMVNASGSKLHIDVSDLKVMWLDGENININGVVKPIDENTVDIQDVAVSSDAFGGFYAVYPGDDFNGNDVDVNNENSNASIILNKLVLNFHDGETTHDVIFPMGGTVNEAGAGEGLFFRHLTAGFLLTLEATTLAELTSLKVIVYGSAEAAPVDLNDVTYTVKWADQAPTVPTGEVGDLTDQDVAYASVMDFDLKTDDFAGLTIGANEAKQLCIPVTLAEVQRITVIGYNGAVEVFAKSSPVAGTPELERNKIYPVKAIPIN